MIKLRVRELAELQGLNIQGLSDRSGVAYSTVLDFWHDTVRRIDKKTLARLSKALGVKPGELLFEDDDEKNVAPAPAY